MQNTWLIYTKILSVVRIKVITFQKLGKNTATLKLIVGRNFISMMDTEIFDALEEEDFLLIAAVLHRRKNVHKRHPCNWMTICPTIHDDFVRM